MDTQTALSGKWGDMYENFQRFLQLEFIFFDRKSGAVESRFFND
jgi:hypothetical protein